jgi:hypothetical protein
MEVFQIEKVTRRTVNKRFQRRIKSRVKPSEAQAERFRSPLNYYRKISHETIASYQRADSVLNKIRKKSAQRQMDFSMETLIQI